METFPHAQSCLWGTRCRPTSLILIKPQGGKRQIRKYGIFSPSPCLSISEIQELRLEKKRDQARVGCRKCSWWLWICSASDLFSEQSLGGKGHHRCLRHEWKPGSPCTVFFSLPRSVFLRVGPAAHSPTTSVCPGDLGKRCPATL